MDLIALGQEELGKVGAILACYACDQSYFFQKDSPLFVNIKSKISILTMAENRFQRPWTLRKWSNRPLSTSPMPAVIFLFPLTKATICRIMQFFQNALERNSDKCTSLANPPLQLQIPESKNYNRKLIIEMCGKMWDSPLSDDQIVSAFLSPQINPV